MKHLYTALDNGGKAVYPFRRLASYESEDFCLCPLDLSQDISRIHERIFKDYAKYSQM